MPALLIIFIRGKYLTESPIWLANQGDLKGAAQVLQESYAINAVATVEKVQRTAEKKKREGLRFYLIKPICQELLWQL